MDALPCWMIEGRKTGHAKGGGSALFCIMKPAIQRGNRQCFLCCLTWIGGSLDWRAESYLCFVQVVSANV